MVIPDFKNHSIKELTSAASDIGWVVEKKIIENSPQEFAERLYFQYRWRSQLADIALKAGTILPEELPNIPYTSENIQECMGKLQPKIRRTKQKNWGWLSLLLLFPFFSSARCVLGNQSLLEAQSEVVRLELETLKAQASEQGWEMIIPETPSWTDVSEQIRVLAAHRESEPMFLSAMRQARKGGIQLELEKPYSLEKTGDFSLWLQLASDDRVLSHPFSLLNVPSGSLMLKDGGIEKVARINHGLWVMNQPVSSELMKVVFDSSKQSEPASQVEWVDAVIFANDLSELVGLPHCYDKDKNQTWQWIDSECAGFRLATEAEWLHIHATLSSSETYSMQANEWCWDMYDPSWLWNLSSDLNDPRIDTVNIGDPSHVLRNDLSSRKSGASSLGSFRLVRMEP